MKEKPSLVQHGSWWATVGGVRGEKEENWSFSMASGKLCGSPHFPSKAEPYLSLLHLLSSSSWAQPLWLGLWTTRLGVWEGADLGSRGPPFQGTACHWNLDSSERCYNVYERLSWHTNLLDPWGLVYKCIPWMHLVYNWDSTAICGMNEKTDG